MGERKVVRLSRSYRVGRDTVYSSDIEAEVLGHIRGMEADCFAPCVRWEGFFYSRFRTEFLTIRRGLVAIESATLKEFAIMQTNSAVEAADA